MKVFTAPRLLTIAFSGEHMDFCPHPTIGKGINCVCVRGAFQAWSDHRKSIASTRVRSLRPQKTHSDHVTCGAKNVRIRTNDDSKVNCRHCIRLINNPPKKRRAKNFTAQLNVN